MKTCLKKICLLVILTLSLNMLFAQTYISSANRNNIISNGVTTWSDSWYIINDPVTITSGGNLTISPNSNILIQCDPSVYFEVDGILNIAGNTQFIITFTEHSSGNGWKGIRIVNNQNPSNFNYCTIEKVQKTANCTTTFGGSGAVFLNNATYVSFDHCTFQYNHTCYGAGLTAFSSQITMNECVFNQNEADVDGGAAYLSDIQQDSWLDKVSFSQNTAGNYGGAVYLENTSNDMTFDECLFDLNEADYGAGLYFKEVFVSNIPVLNNCQITMNTAASEGGGIYLHQSQIEDISACLIQNNDANMGAGIYALQSEIINLTSCEIMSNEAQGNGGGVYLMESDANIRLCQIKSNVAGNNGGGLHLEGSPYFGQPTNIINCLIAENIANNHGGGIWATYTFSSFNNTIADNHAQNGDGGGIYHDNCSSTVVNTILWGNTAVNYNYNQAFPPPDGNNGYSYCCANGGVANCNSCTGANPDFAGNGSYMIIKSSSCRDAGDNNVQHENIDLVGGNRITNSTIDIGAYEHPYLYVCGSVDGQTWTDHNPNGTDYIVECDIYVSSGNSFTINANTSIAFDGLYSLNVLGNLTATGYSTTNILFTATSQNTGWSGINLGLGSGNPYSGTAYLSYCEIEYVKKVQTIIDNKEDDPEYSGAIFIHASPNAIVTIDNCKIHDNYVSSNGGGILCYDCPNDVVISNSLIYNNEAEIRGGGISLIGDNSAQILSNNIYSNTTYMGGGGIWIDAFTYLPSPAPYIYGNNIFSNYTYGEDKVSGGTSYPDAGGGGGLGSYKSNAIVEHNFFHYNHSEEDIYGNYGYGGGVYWSNSTGYATFTDNTVYHNSAKYGGGFYCYQSPVEISNSRIYDENYASDDGGGLFIADGNPVVFNCYIEYNTSDDDGGGIYINATSSPTLYNLLIDNNSATNSGGGIYVEDGTSTQIVNCTIADNSPDGANITSSGNSVKLYNSIAWFNYNGDDVVYNGNPPNPAWYTIYDYCDFGNFGGIAYGNIDADPKFVGSGDYRISCQYSSPCHDAGDNSKLYTGLTSTDIRGGSYSRTVSCSSASSSNNNVDMGAYEYEYAGDCDLVPRSQAHYKKSQNDSIQPQMYSSFVIYPNPAEDGFFIQLKSEVEGIVSIYLINSLGEEVLYFSRDASEGKKNYFISRNNLASGIYYLKIDSKITNFSPMKVVFK